jgi:hypothetical protein
MVALAIIVSPALAAPPSADPKNMNIQHAARLQNFYLRCMDGNAVCGKNPCPEGVGLPNGL